MAATDATTLTVIDALLNVRRLSDTIRDIVNISTAVSPSMKDIGTMFGQEKGGGRSVEIPARFGVNLAGQGVLGGDGPTATPAAGKYDKQTVTVYPVNMSSKIGHLDVQKSASGVQALQSVLNTAKKDIEDGFPIVQSYLMWERGDGVVSRIDTTITVATGEVTVDDALTAGGDNTFGLGHIGVSAYLQATSDRTLTEPDRVSVAQVTVNPSGTLKFKAGGGSIADWANDDYLVWKDMLNNAPGGIGSWHPLFQTAGFSYLGLSTTTYPELLMTRKTSIGTGNIEDALVGALLQVLTERGDTPSMGLVPWRVYKEMFVDAKVDRRFTNVVTPGKQKYAQGFQAVSITSPGGGTIEFYVDRFMPQPAAGASTGMLVVIKPENIKFVRPEGKGPDWYRGPHGDILHEIPDTYGQKLVMLDHYNLINLNPGVGVSLEGITVAS